MKRYLLITTIFYLLLACASVPFDAPKTPTSAFTDTEETYLGSLVGSLRQERDDDASGFYLASDGIEALAARLLLTAQAERSIDMQYYLVHQGEITTRLLISQLIKAADRGVRVRLLIDDINATSDSYDIGMAAVDSHLNIAIRVFNPFSRGSGRALSAVTEFSRINRRMHNKSMTFDNQVTIVGGRNIGDIYFQAGTDTNYKDLDVLGFGPVAQSVSAAFDEYWNNRVAVPVDALIEAPDAASLLAAWRERIVDILEEIKQSPYGEAVDFALEHFIGEDESTLTWANALVVADSPDKALIVPEVNDPELLRSKLGPAVRAATSELVVVSAYFVPREFGTQLLTELAQRGVRVSITTNSLASNDVVPVHAGYAHYRKALLRGGVELWEISPSRADVVTSNSGGIGSSRSGLHTKTFVVDRRYLFIGSFNWDPRSANINTEMGIYLDAPKLARLVAESIDLAQPKRAYRLVLNQADEIEWLAYEDGREVIYREEPEASFWRRFQAGFYGLLPLEEQL